MNNQNLPPQIFEADYYQKLYKIEENHWWAKGMREAMDSLLQKALTNREKLRILDAGCGTGYLLDYLKKYPISSEVTGLDYSHFALRFCQKRGASNLVMANAVNPPFRPNSFDLIICIDTLQHLSPTGADQTAVTRFANLLRPNGLLYLRTNSALGHKPLADVDPDQYRRYTKLSLTTIAQNAGLQVERASYLNMLPSLWGWLKEYQPRNPPTAPIGPGLKIKMPKTPLVNQLMHAILKIEALAIGRLEIDLPFGHSLALLARLKD